MSQRRQQVRKETSDCAGIEFLRRTPHSSAPCVSSRLHRLRSVHQHLCHRRKQVRWFCRLYAREDRRDASAYSTFGHSTCPDECPLLAVKRTCRERAVMSASDPKRRSG